MVRRRLVEAFAAQRRACDRGLKEVEWLALERVCFARVMPEQQERTPPAEASGRLRVGGWARRAAAQGRAVDARLQRERPHHATIEVAYRCLRRDLHIAGGVLGGGLAYRIYFWALGMVRCGRVPMRTMPLASSAGG